KMSTNVDDISSVNKYGANEPPFEQLVTDSDEEYDVNKDLYAESYLDDEEWDENDYTSEEESDVEVKDKGECFASDSEKEKFKNVLGKRFDNEDNDKISLEKFMMFVDIKEFRSALTDYTIQENFDIIRVKNEKARVTAICASGGSMLLLPQTVLVL
ncbi:hypothetical protein PIB30_088433, partial [Stylosanthes scabra]|nr:hypothetical protein [Stylosanthes scabra]